MAPKIGIDIHADAADLSTAPIDISNSGNNSIIIGVPNKLIRVYKLFFIASAATTIIFRDGQSTVLSGSTSFSTNEGIVLDFDTKPWFTTSYGNDFVMSLGTAVQVGGAAYYTQDS